MTRTLSIRAAAMVLLLAAGAALVGACSTQVSPLHTSPSSTPMQSPGPVVPAEGTATEHRDYTAAWASAMIGAPVVDNGGRHLGVLRDIVIDSGTGVVRAVLVSHALAGGEQLLAAPIRLVKQTRGEAVFLDLDRRAFLGQPTWRGDDAAVLRASSLLGSRVQSAAGRTLGRIGDVVIDTNRGAVHYAVLYLDSAEDVATEHAFAVPLVSLDFGAGAPGPARIVLDVSHERLASLVGVDRDQRWGPLGVRYLGRIDRRFGTAWPRGAGPVGATK